MDTVNTNRSAMQAHQASTSAASALAVSQNRVTTGKRVGSAKDNGAIWSMATGMTAEAHSWSRVSESLSRGMSILDVAANSVDEVSDILTRVREKALAYGDPSLSDQSRATLQADIAALVSQMDRTVDSASFDGQNVLNRAGGKSWQVSSATQSGPTLNIHFDGASNYLGAWAPFGVSVVSATHTADSNGAVTNVTVPPMYPSGNGDQHVDWPLDLPAGVFNVTFSPAVGYYGFGGSGPPEAPVEVLSDTAGNRTHIGEWNLKSSALGLTPLNWNNPKALLGSIQSALQQVTDVGASIGAQQSALDANIATANVQNDGLTTGVGNLVDADMAKEAAALQANQVKQSLASKALAIANAAPQWITALFRA